LASRSLECLIEEHEAREAAEADSSASVSIPAVIPVRKSA
jgi:Rrf2 family iron-sulfur cluster assembly transcriptional regulator